MLSIYIARNLVASSFYVGRFRGMPHPGGGLQHRLKLVIFAKTIWGDYFGIWTDKFGIDWMIGFNENQS